MLTARVPDAVGAGAGTAHDSASARSQASPARVRRIGSSAPAGAGDEEVRGGAGDDDAHDVAGARDGAALGHVEVHEPAVFGAAREPVVPLVAAALAGGDEHLDGAADERLVLLAGDALLQVDEPLVALLHDLPSAPGRAASRPGVPGRIEYWKVYAEANRACSTTRSVSWKSSSVSPGNPTMMSVLMAAFGMRSRTRSRMPRKRSER